MILQEWTSKGHGSYSELSSEKDFFDVCKESKNVVCHFYKTTTFRCVAIKIFNSKKFFFEMILALSTILVVKVLVNIIVYVFAHTAVMF